MKIHVPEISNQIYEDDVLKVLKSNYSTIGPLWVIHQFEWINSTYQPYKDHDKYLIIIYLIKTGKDKGYWKYKENKVKGLHEK